LNRIEIPKDWEMEVPPIVPPSYPDAEARGTTRSLSKLLEQKFVYYGGRNPHPQKEQANAPVQNQFRNSFLNTYRLVSAREDDPGAVFEDAARVLPHAYSFHPDVLAVAMSIIRKRGLRTMEDVLAPDRLPQFKRDFKSDFSAAWPTLSTMLSKTKKKGTTEKKLPSFEVQAQDVFRYIEAYLRFSEQ
jgi:hypothetical protein